MLHSTCLRCSIRVDPVASSSPAPHATPAALLAYPLSYAIKRPFSPITPLVNSIPTVSLGGLKKHDHISPAFKELGWSKIKQKHILDVSMAMYSLLHATRQCYTLDATPKLPTTYTNTCSKQRTTITSCYTIVIYPRRYNVRTHPVPKDSC
ncbi:hypothetical protein Pcinc_022498 [Petrolisthes cinctipes]|uniref:Uncharacterized protein n=1 Tax=Petrolisthes cinctipes TaxID=88211 RepID=A0AAE1KFU8_PETCI|nr:hypothetical protein Pcinc_022498 [Petrolisthes cinctipes]